MSNAEGIASIFFQNLKNSISSNLHTSGICRVSASNGSEYTVTPLYKDTEGNALQPITSVKGLKQRFIVDGGTVRMYTPVYQVGDIVLVTFTEHALENTRGKTLKRRHSLTDAVIVGIWG